MSIVLIGYRGSGKTTTGQKLADRLWQDLVDTDKLIVKKAGKTIKEIFEQEGEQNFRNLESEVVREVVKLQDVVISMGGGAVLREENRQAIKESGHKVIYLKCEPTELHRRIEADEATSMMRPNLTQFGGVEEIERVLAEREAIYREMKTAELDVTNLSPEEAMVYIVRLL
ncbi:MAG: shikimate kinase [Phycisphaerales bacterium]|nr:shikimate kinase [Phycisphaerales bacterium]